MIVYSARCETPQVACATDARPDGLPRKCAATKPYFRAPLYLFNAKKTIGYPNVVRCTSLQSSSTPHFEIKTTKQDEPASFHLRTRSTVPSGEKPRREGSERVRRVKTRSRECSQPSHVHALPGLALMSKTIWYQFGPVALTTRPNGISNEVQMSRSFSDTFTLTLSTASSSFAACSKS